jgi:hypothetical protein
MPPKVKECPPGKIRNPSTGRCVNIDGKIGKAITKKKVQDPKTECLKALKDTCNNDADPISMESFADIDLDQLKSVVMIGTGKKRNCYLLGNIYQVYKTAIESNKPVKDPMDPSHVLTNDEIADINKKMKKHDPKYKPPKYVSPREHPAGYTLEINVVSDLFSILVKRGARLIRDFGVVPAWVETHHTGSADNTSGVLVANIRELWDRRLLTTDDRTLLGYNAAYWRGATWRAKFIALCNQVRDRLQA